MYNSSINKTNPNVVTNQSATQKALSDNQEHTQNIKLFQSIIKDLQDKQTKLDPKRLIEICIAAIKQEDNCPPELTQDAFKSLQTLAKAENSNRQPNKFSEPFAKFLSIAFMCLKGKDAFIAPSIHHTEQKVFDYASFTTWLSTNFPNSIAVDKLLEEHFRDIRLYSTSGKVFFYPDSGNEESAVNIDDAFITKTYDYGKYVGEFVAGKGKGYGILVLNPNYGGMKFEGTFVDDGIKEGKLTYPNGGILEGIFENGNIVQGTQSDPAKGEKYVGSFAGENKRHGEGTYENNEIVGNCFYKNVVKGQWNNDKLNGDGEWSRFKCVPDKNRQFSLILDSEYKGTYREGLRHGNGVLIYSSGTKYEGEWQYDKKHGEGTLFLGLGGTFKGTFDNDLPVCGKYTTSDGKRTIEGSCNRNFKIEGRGVLKDDVSGEVYQGEFKDGKKHGFGVSKYENKKLTYEGKFENNIRIEGKLIFADGSHYEGDFLNNEMNQGILTNEATGVITKGNWGGCNTLNGEVTTTYKIQKSIIKAIFENGHEKTRISEDSY